MAKIKQIKVYSSTSSSWKTGDIGADASNIDLASAIGTNQNVQDAIQYLNTNKISKISGFEGAGSNNEVSEFLINTNTIGYRVKADDFDDTISSPSSEKYQDVFQILDTNDHMIGFLEQYQETSGTIGLGLAARKYVSGSQVSNYLFTNIANDGTLSYTVASPSAFRSAINAQATLTQGSNISISSANSISATGLVPTSRTVNGHALTGNINVTLSDLKLDMSSNMNQMGFYLTASDYPYLRWTDTSSNQYQIVLGSNKLSYQTKTTGGSWVNDFSLEANSVSAKTQSGTKSLATSTDATIMNTGSLAVGKYLIVAGCAFSSNASGQRAVYFTTNSAGGDAILQGRIALPVTGQPRYQVSMLLNVNTATTYYLGVWQNSGSALTVSGGYMNILKLNS